MSSEQHSNSRGLRWVDIEQGLIGGLCTAAIIFCINLTGGAEKALQVAIVQLLYTSLMMTVNTTLCRRFVKRGFWWGVWIPTGLTTAATAMIHIMIASPEPLWSTLFSFTLAFFSFVALSLRFQRSDKTLWALTKSGLSRIRRR